MEDFETLEAIGGGLEDGRVRADAADPGTLAPLLKRVSPRRRCLEMGPGQAAAVDCLVLSSVVRARGPASGIAERTGSGRDARGTRR